MDTVFINQLEVQTHIGVWEWEQQLPRKLLIDLEMDWDNTVPGQSDDLNDALDYHAISVAVQQMCTDASCQLIETLAESVWMLLKDEFKISKAVIRITKPGAVSGVQSLGVKIVRENG